MFMSDYNVKGGLRSTIILIIGCSFGRHWVDAQVWVTTEKVPVREWPVVRLQVRGWPAHQQKGFIQAKLIQGQRWAR